MEKNVKAKFVFPIWKVESKFLEAHDFFFHSLQNLVLIEKTNFENVSTRFYIGFTN